MSMGWAELLTVEQVFQLRGIGLTVIPDFSVPKAGWKNGAHRVRVVKPNGEDLEADANFHVWHFNIRDPAAPLAPNCKGQGLLNGILNSPEGDGDEVNLFNPPECAPDFTKNYNVTAIVLNVPIADLGGTVFDTWSTISVAQ